jgi:hypothetical protein
MPLISTHFKGNDRLQRCSADNSAHIVLKSPPERGPHVSLIQEALFQLMDNVNLGDELATSSYGPKTAAAVLRYKQNHKPPIVNRSYQTSADNVVGVMTITCLDEDMHKRFGGKPSPAKPALPGAPGGGAQKVDPWSVNGFFGFMLGAGGADHMPNLGQFGFSLYKFRNDTNGVTRTYVSPTFGAGFSFDVPSLLKWLRGIKDRNLGKYILADRLAWLALHKGLTDPKALLKEIAMAVATNTSTASEWTDFSKCEVLYPVTHSLLDGKTIGSASVTLGVPFQIQKIWVYGQVREFDSSGNMVRFHRRDLLKASSSGWQIQVPALSAGFVGGPLIML